ncbi:MAG: glycosyltransferase family 39 protein [Kouleothrix sp.]|nr:glycosyltransferase family 39 protein [Kouleothrix sp.]
MADKNAIPFQTGAAARDAPRARVDLWALAGYLLVGAAALVPRALDLGRFITDDEANFWLYRSDVFLKALRSGDYLQTAITNHPGVTTMWLGAAGILLRRPLLDWGLLQSDAFPVVLATMRLPVVLAHVLVILLSYGLLRRMLPPALALLAALLWAADPFVIGYSRLLHTDALAASFATLSLLAACCYWNHAGARRWLVVSGVAAGLAFLSKSPALAVVPAVGLVALLAATKDQGPRTKGANAADRRSALVFGLWSLGLPLAAWLAVAALTVFALWPALWVNPLEAYRLIRVGVEVEGAQPHMLGNFFLGRADDAPGLLYYPVALALRLTPITLLGLLALPLAWRTIAPLARRRDRAALAGFAVLFVTAMSLFPKKFDRYIVPAFPAIDVLAAAGLVGLGAWVLRLGSRLLARSHVPNHNSLAQSVWVGIIALMAIVNVAYWQPYQIVAFNQLLGGAAAGARTFTVGWGEGLEQVADWLNAQPDITGVRVVALRITSLNPYLKEGAQADFPKGDLLRDRTGYVVVYLPQVQAGPPSGPFAQFYGRVEPLYTVRIHGVDMAWIYRAPPTVAQRRPAAFGSDIRLEGFDANGEWRRGQTVQLKLLWQTSARPPADYWLFAHLIGPDNQRYAQLDLPYPTSQWAPGRAAPTDLPIAVPKTAPPGAYRLLIGLYSPGQARLPLTPDDPADAAADSPDSLVLARFELR